MKTVCYLLHRGQETKPEKFHQVSHAVPASLRECPVERDRDHPGETSKGYALRAETPRRAEQGVLRVGKLGAPGALMGALAWGGCRWSPAD